MATYKSADLDTKALYGGDDGNAFIYYGTSVATGTAVTTADKLRICKVPAGTKVSTVIVTNTTFGTTVPATIQFEPLDGSTAVSFGSTDGVTLQTASANGTLFHKDAVLVAKDSYVTLLLGTVSTGNGTGVASVTVLGEGFGAK